VTTSDPFDYLESRDDADELISDFGQSVSLRRVVASGTAWEPTLTPTDYVTKAAIVDYTIQQRKDSDIQANDRRALVAAGPLTALGITGIAAPDKLLVGGVAVPVVIAKPINPAGVTVMYDCQLRF
jgi:hypothetical protein